MERAVNIKVNRVQIENYFRFDSFFFIYGYYTKRFTAKSTNKMQAVTLVKFNDNDAHTARSESQRGKYKYKSPKRLESVQ